MCYHIYWTKKDQMDWECHPTRQAAEWRATELVLRDETYTIVEQQHSGDQRNQAKTRDQHA